MIVNNTLCFAKELLVRFVNSEKNVKVKCRTEDHANALALALLNWTDSGPIFFGGDREIKITSASYYYKEVCINFHEFPHKMILYWPNQPPAQGRTVKMTIEDELIDVEDFKFDIQRVMNKHLKSIMDKRGIGPNEFFVSGSFVMSLDDDDDIDEK